MNPLDAYFINHFHNPGKLTFVNASEKRAAMSFQRIHRARSCEKSRELVPWLYELNRDWLRTFYVTEKSFCGSGSRERSRKCVWSSRANMSAARSSSLPPLEDSFSVIFSRLDRIESSLKCLEDIKKVLVEIEGNTHPDSDGILSVYRKIVPEKVLSWVRLEDWHFLETVVISLLQGPVKKWGLGFLKALIHVLISVVSLLYFFQLLSLVSHCDLAYM